MKDLTVMFADEENQMNFWRLHDGDFCAIICLT